MADATIWSSFFITDAGLRLRNEVMAEKGEVEYTAAVGTGKPASPLDIGSMTSLVNHAEPAFVIKSFVDEEDGNHAMVIRVDNEGFANEVLVTEVGVSARKNSRSPWILYGYCYCVVGFASFLPGSIIRRRHDLVFNTKISRASQVTIQYSGRAMEVTFEELEEALANYYRKEETYPKVEIDSLLSNKANKDDAETVEEVANEAQNTANDAQAAADAAQDTAATAQAAANTAQAAATAAQAAADAAQAAANTALSAANAAMPKSGGAFTGSVTMGQTDLNGWYGRNILFRNAASTNVASCRLICNRK